MHAATDRNLRRMLGTALFFAAVLAVAGYAYLKFAALLWGPSIAVAITPPVGTTTSLATIAGVARNAKSLTLAGRPIFIDLEGRFSEKLLLFPGYNIIELAAKDVRGKEERKTIEIVYQKTGAGNGSESGATTSLDATQEHLPI